MQSLFGISLVALMVMHVQRANRQEQLFASWQEAQRTAKSLVIQFTLITRDPIFEEGEKAEGTLRLICTADGNILGSYEITPPKIKNYNPDQLSAILYKGIGYVLNHDKKTAFRMEPADADLRQFLEEYFNPFVTLTDEEHAKQKCYLEVTKQDERYTYLSMKPKDPKSYGWLEADYHQARAVLMNKASETVPKDMRCQLWYTDGRRSYTFEIKSWRLNAADAPKPDEFIRPEDRPGWQVTEWPFGK